jgi:hypothetical protein
MPQKRPVAVVVIAVLQLVFGAIGLCGSAVQLTGAQNALTTATQVNPPPGQPSPPTAQDIENYLEKKVPNYHTLTLADGVVDLVLSVLMVASGIGLLQLRSWGRLLAVVYAVLSILAKVAGTAFAFALVVPAMSDFARELEATRGKEAALMGQVMQISIIAAAVFGAVLVVYPILVLIVLSRRSVRAAFAGTPVPGEPEDYRDAGPSEGLAGPDDRFQPGGP